MKIEDIDHTVFLDHIISGYKLTRKVGAGKIGFVFEAKNETHPFDRLACKIIPEGKLKPGWERELEKVIKLAGVESVVQYHSHGTSIDKNQRPFNWIFWNFIDGTNLREYGEKRPWPLDIAFIENIANVILAVLFACNKVEITHGDLHAGNILISNPDERVFESQRKIWVSDFGYGGSHNSLEPKDDFRQLFSIILTLLNGLRESDLNPTDRIMHQKLKVFFGKTVMEIDPTQGRHVNNLEILIREFRKLRTDSEREVVEASKGQPVREVGDFLSAEMLGLRADEWKNLFVPDFLAARDLLSKNITILTGARGCGKTMTFRRLTAYMDKVIGTTSGVPGADEFIGFYLNCRDLIEAFPSIPHSIDASSVIPPQIIHYFHLCWMGEVCKTLSVQEVQSFDDFRWLDQFLLKQGFIKYQSLPKGSNILSHVMAFVELEKESCRLTDFGKKKSPQKSWPLSKHNFLDELQAAIQANCSWVHNKPFYFFLDDYTIPIIPRNIQRVLNPIIFKRRSHLFFKVSTESAISFEQIGLRGKPLELHQDFELIDLATESLYQSSAGKISLIQQIFAPRIERHINLKDKGLTLQAILGQTPWSSNEVARMFRAAAQGKKKQKVYYHGIDAFAGLWASDIRIMIQMFVDLLRESDAKFKANNYLIDKVIQDKVYRAAGGEFLAHTASVPNPAFLERQTSVKKNMNFGSQLKDIVETFVLVSRYEMTHGPMITNQKTENPKQAFRLEIIDKFELDAQAQEYYDGLVRWHIFLQDYRGKSVRGMITPRLFLNRVLIPHAQLTFSSHDNIHMNNQQLSFLLKEPKNFLKSWVQKSKRKRGREQGSFDF